MRPSTSGSVHLFMKAVQQWDHDSGAARNRSSESILIKCFGLCAACFFANAWTFRAGKCEIAKDFGADIGAVEQCAQNGAAFARLDTDYNDADEMRIEGGPSFVLNEGAGYSAEILDSADRSKYSRALANTSNRGSQLELIPNLYGRVKIMHRNESDGCSLPRRPHSPKSFRSNFYQPLPSSPSRHAGRIMLHIAPSCC